MCVVCRQMMPKAELLRIVRSENGDIHIDFTGKANGRGAYVCNKPECVMHCIKKKTLNHTFKCNVSDTVYEQIAEEYAKQNS